MFLNVFQMGAWETIEKELKGKIGERDSEIIGNIVLAYLSEKGYLKKKGRVENGRGKL